MFKKMIGLASGNATEKKKKNEDVVLPMKTELEACPLSKDELGTATWGLMHTAAAYYPQNPTPDMQERARAFFGGLAHMYPCSYCKKDFEKEIAKEPPRVESRLALSLWVCRQHNTVNAKLGKEQFECTLPNLDQRWKTGKKSCWGQEDERADLA
ncbi:unnamed protein product [Choristocarpus tenellus]